MLTVFDTVNDQHYDIKLVPPRMRNLCRDATIVAAARCSEAVTAVHHEKG